MTTTTFAEGVRSLGLDSLHIVIDWEEDCSAAGVTSLPSRSPAALDVDAEFWLAIGVAFDRAADKAAARLGVPLKVRLTAFDSAESDDWSRRDRAVDPERQDAVDEYRAEAYQEIYEQLDAITVHDDGTWTIRQEVSR